jgi:hypothetical protein
MCLQHPQTKKRATGEARTGYIGSKPGKSRVVPEGRNREENIVGNICWKCGAEVPAGSAACPKCGAAVTGAQPAASSSPFSQGQSPFAQGPSPFTPAQPAAGQGQGYTSPPPPPSASFQPAAPPPFQPSAPSPQPGFAPVQQGYAPAPPPPPGTVPAPVAAGSGGGSSAVKIILIILGVIVLLVILVVGAVGFGIWRVAHAVHQAAHNGTVTIPGANGASFSMNTEKTYSASELGIDIYPGATAIKGGMRFEVPGGSTTTGIFTTSDSKDQVEAFYKDKMGSDVTSMDMGDAAILTVKKGDKEQVMVTVSNKANQNDGKTTIAITHTITSKP